MTAIDYDALLADYHKFDATGMTSDQLVMLADMAHAIRALRAALAESEREVAVYRDWHDDVMAKCRANDLFDGYGNTMRLTPATAAQEKANG